MKKIGDRGDTFSEAPLSGALNDTPVAPGAAGTADAVAVGTFGMGGGLTGNNSSWPDVGQGFSGASAMVITGTNLRVGMGARVQNALQGGGSVQIKWSISKIGDV